MRESRAVPKQMTLLDLGNMCLIMLVIFSQCLVLYRLCPSTLCPLIAIRTAKLGFQMQTAAIFSQCLVIHRFCISTLCSLIAIRTAKLGFQKQTFGGWRMRDSPYLISLETVIFLLFRPQHPSKDFFCEHYIWHPC